MISLALNSNNFEIGNYLLDKYFSSNSNSLTFKAQLSIDEKFKLNDHQMASRRTLSHYFPQFQISLEYFAEELQKKPAMDFILGYFSKKLKSENLLNRALTFNDVKADIMTPLQKAVSLNKDAVF